VVMVELLLLLLLLMLLPLLLLLLLFTYETGASSTEDDSPRGHGLAHLGVVLGHLHDRVVYKSNQLSLVL